MKTVRMQLKLSCLIVALLLFVTACGVNKGSENDLIYMSSFSFVPSTITVKAGENVTLRFKNTETFWGFPHDWTLMEAGYKAEAPWTDEDSQHVLVQKLVHPNETETLTFTAPSKPGEYQIVCTISLDAGMKGTLIVTP